MHGGHPLQDPGDVLSLNRRTCLLGRHEDIDMPCRKTRHVLLPNMKTCCLAVEQEDMYVSDFSCYSGAGGLLGPACAPVKFIFASRGAFRPVPLAAGGEGAVWPGLRVCECNFGFTRCFQAGLVTAGGSCMAGIPCKTPGTSSRSTGGRVFLVATKTSICLVEKQDTCSCPI